MKIPDRSRLPAGRAASRAPSHFKDSLSYDESIGQCRPAYPMMSRVHWTVQAAEWRQPGLEGLAISLVSDRLIRCNAVDSPSRWFSSTRL